MKNIVLILSAMLISIFSYSQLLHTGKNNASTPLFDSGRVTLGVKEYNFDSCGSAKKQIYKCEFTFSNNNSYPVILKRYDFYTDNETDSSGRVGCAIACVGTAKNSDTLAANTAKIVMVSGETFGMYQPSGTFVKYGCIYYWKFNGFIPYKK